MAGSMSLGLQMAPGNCLLTHLLLLLLLLPVLGVTDEETLLSPENSVHPDYYMSQLSELLTVKETANVAA
jgi:hypothetical protein